mmetsp:Transcript_11672/g.25348  ORF Transcript_11672/g.25348 Transcript_11672/m.25348 type:complete len:541 (+) Transcript_11672:101-1723(+)
MGATKIIHYGSDDLAVIVPIPPPSAPPSAPPPRVPVAFPPPAFTATANGLAGTCSLAATQPVTSTWTELPRKAEQYIAPAVLPHSTSTLPHASLFFVTHTPAGDCRICRLPLSSSSSSSFSANAQLAKLQCGHVFHRSCIEASLHHHPKCPTCGDSGCIEPPLGTSPSGTMHHSILRDKPCPGFADSPSTILIEYDVPHATQKPYHPHPGRNFHGFLRRKAYLPNNDAGRDLLTRIIYAWKRGLVFSVGTSKTSGRSDSIVWSSLVPHKTSFKGGPHGWPDEDYLRVCHEKLNALLVPDAEVCERRMSGADAMTFGQMPMITVPIVLREGIEYDDDSMAKIPQTLDLKPISRFPLSNEACRICRRLLSSGFCVEVRRCKHAFHQCCLERGGLRGCNRCPVCGASYGEPRGNSPSGTMSIDLENSVCPGFAPAKTIKLRYRIPSGIQKAYHPNPGRRYGGTNRTAYLPNNEEGILLLQRLKYAWTHGLTFTVGYSITNKRDDCVTWATIPHKTRLDGGEYGFPDPIYIQNCNQCLDDLLLP